MTHTPTPRREPRTAAGRRLVAEDWDDGANRRPAERSFGNFNRMADVIAAIEAEARALALSELEEAVGGLEPRDFEEGHTPSGWFYDGWNEATDAVIQLIRAKQGRPEEER